MLFAQNISKIIQKRTIIQDFSLILKKGEEVGLLGPNGAGKTTCFSMLIGVLFPDTGKIYLDDEDITSLPIHKRAKRGMAYLPQDSSIFRGMTVEQNITSVLELVWHSPQTREEKLEKILDDFSITHLRNAFATTLSGGERRRTEIARALAMEPKYILLDEPFAGIDPIAICEIKEIIMRLKNEKIGVLITDHNVRETLSIVDHAYIMSNGKLLASGTPDDIIKNDTVRKTYLGDLFTL
jgi:lipopolysaccharide export system ATP-binding protein